MKRKQQWNKQKMYGIGNEKDEVEVEVEQQTNQPIKQPNQPAQPHRSTKESVPFVCFSVRYPKGNYLFSFGINSWKKFRSGFTVFYDDK